MSVASWFLDFCNGIAVDKRAVISTRYQSLTKRLNIDFWGNTSETQNSRYVGSYGRNTATNLVSDIDFLFRLPLTVYNQYNDYTYNGQSALLQAVKTSVERTYSVTKIKADGQIISIPFNDGIEFELLPAFKNNDGSFTFANANNGGSWKTTNPMPELEAMRTRNLACNNNLVLLCRMMRHWKATQNVPISGMLIDTLAYQFIISWPNRDKSYLYYDFMCRDFFDFLANQDADQVYWLAPGSGQWVFKSGQFQYRARQCHKLAREAIAYEMSDPKREGSAMQKWKEIFGTKFPS